jgi:hypothetical protein
MGIVQRTEEQWIHKRHRTGTHREDVPQYAPDTGCRTLVWLDRRRVIMALDAYRNGYTIANIYHAGILARANQYLRTCRRQAT